MHPSESAGIMLVPVEFDGAGYRSWRIGVLRALSMNNKVIFITRKCMNPNAGEVPSWILNLLSKDLVDSLQYVNDAKELWQELKDKYDQTNGAKIYQFAKGNERPESRKPRYNRLLHKNEEAMGDLNTLNAHAQCGCQCTYGAKANMHKAEQDQRLIQFQMRLNEVYTVVRGSILMMNPLPNIAQAFYILIQEEK
ncbi:uncharacterized protein LOC142169199 [Nicotiana tabacum]|uniref:Uncharacterized protein LOC142169199 n=1 Tax=Nicotiana tabacum TaxID=4097 RepID=A0AC58SNJ1_TOBAC